MNTLLFLSAMGCGALATGITFIILVHFLWRNSKANAENNKDYTEETIKLMRERNEHAAESSRCMKTIEEWCLKRWEP